MPNIAKQQQQEHEARLKEREDKDEFIRKLLKLMAKYDSCSDLFWDENLEFNINCNDIFAWGCSDDKIVTPENIDVLEQSYKDIGYIYASMLFCARVRKMRPQGAAYPKDKELWKWFDGCGPERPVGIGNPRKPGEPLYQ